MKTQQLQKIRSGKKNFDETDKKNRKKLQYISTIYIFVL